MSSSPDESPIEIEARAILAGFNDALHKEFTKRIKQHLIVSEVSVTESNYVWISETLHILGTALWWELVKKMCLYWQDKFDLLFLATVDGSRRFSSDSGTMGWTGGMIENEEAIARILGFSRFWIQTEFLRQEVKRKTDTLLQSIH